MTDEKVETWSRFGMSKVRSRPESTYFTVQAWSENGQPVTSIPNRMKSKPFQHVRSSLLAAVHWMLVWHAHPIAIDLISRLRRDRNNQRTNDRFGPCCYLEWPSMSRSSSIQQSRYKRFALSELFIIRQPFLIGRSAHSEGSYLRQRRGTCFCPCLFVCK